ncbi:hypothetical protein H5410_055110 [Solanum commersonii]|uniref:Uncharacterized protein n=1 Tax=Solanum commersonii TaxID=4109 RepID=A0A9J5WJ02_SOLCO|nr:hypothetical protein H5410_055110 [Solanum commersonii]
MVLRSLREVTEEFEKLKLESEMLENHMLKEEICSSCFYKHMRKQDVQLEIVKAKLFRLSLEILVESRALEK